jgi:ATP-dependent Lon protease
VSAALAREISLLELKGKIESQAQQEMSDAQRQYYLRQQLKAIQDELGENEGATRRTCATASRRRAARARAHRGHTRSSTGSSACRRPHPSTR